MNESDLNRLADIFRTVLELEPDRDVSSVRQLTEDKWDSLAHVSIVAAIESEFRLSLDSSEMERMTSFAAAGLIIEENIP